MQRIRQRAATRCLAWPSRPACCQTSHSTAAGTASAAVATGAKLDGADLIETGRRRGWGGGSKDTRWPGEHAQQ
ncbi:hypothetical protein [Streptomyces sp. NPDC002324]